MTVSHDLQEICAKPVLPYKDPIVSFVLTSETRRPNAVRSRIIDTLDENEKKRL